MSQTLTISDALYEKLAEEARERGLPSVETLLEKRHVSPNSLREEELRRRREAVARADAIRERIAAAVGEMPDSVPLIREDRER